MPPPSPSSPSHKIEEGFDETGSGSKRQKTCNTELSIGQGIFADEKDPAELLELGLEELSHGNLDKATTAFDDCLEALLQEDPGSMYVLDNPNYPAMGSHSFMLSECYFQTGLLHQKQGDLVKALAFFRQAIKELPRGCVPAKLHAARLLLMDADDSQKKEAESLLKSLLGLSTRDQTNGQQRSVRDVRAIESAKRRYALLCYHEDRLKEADNIVQALGYELRLASNVLKYSKERRSSMSISPAMSRVVCMVDDALPICMLKQMITTFVGDSTNSTSPTRFWKEHRYREIDGHYFSYAHTLQVQQDETKDEKQQQQQSPPASTPFATSASSSSSSSSSSVPVHSMLDVVVKYLQKIAQKRFPDVAKATHAEWWAHRRPHQSGHQLHYDSDNEGVSNMKDAKVRHPIASTVLYLTEGDVGGPTLVTDQTRSSSAKDVLKTQGVLAYPKRNRVVVFDGKVLHGVIPGHGIVKKGERRVTFMCAFWKGLKTRPASTVPGASQMIPRNSCSFYSWHSQNVAAPIPSEMDQTTSNPKPRYPVAVAQVWDTLNAHRQNDNPTTTGTSLTYDSCFQGF